MIIPFRNCFLKGTERTRDVILQNYYQKKYQQDVVVTHQNIYEDPVAVQFMLDALDNPGTVDPDRALEDFPTVPPAAALWPVSPTTDHALWRNKVLFEENPQNAGLAGNFESIYGLAPVDRVPEGWSRVEIGAGGGAGC